MSQFKPLSRMLTSHANTLHIIIRTTLIQSGTVGFATTTIPGSGFSSKRPSKWLVPATQFVTRCGATSSHTSCGRVKVPLITVYVVPSISFIIRIDSNITGSKVRFDELQVSKKKLLFDFAGVYFTLVADVRGFAAGSEKVHCEVATYVWVVVQCVQKNWLEMRFSKKWDF